MWSWHSASPQHMITPMPDASGMMLQVACPSHVSAAPGTPDKYPHVFELAIRTSTSVPPTCLFIIWRSGGGVGHGAGFASRIWSSLAVGSGCGCAWLKLCCRNGPAKATRRMRFCSKPIVNSSRRRSKRRVCRDWENRPREMYRQSHESHKAEGRLGQTR